MKILNRRTGAVIWESPCSTMRETVLAAVRARIDLRGSNLRGSNLSGSDLSYSNLSDSDLSYSNLSDSDLRGSNLRDSDLSYSNLSGSNLSYSNLSGSNLSGSDLSYSNLSYSDLSYSNLSYSDLSYSDLSGSDLSGSDLSYSDLSGSDLSGSDLRDVRADFISEVLKLPNELDFLRDALTSGKVDGSTYSGECACLAGTLAHAKGLKSYAGEPIKNGLTFTADSSSPRERFFSAIRKGDTPETNGACKIALAWTEEAIAIRDNIRKGRRD